MKRPLALAVLLASLLPAVPAGPAARAEEMPYLEFVRTLRERRYPDLALEYLTRLAKNPPPEVAAILPLEMARTRVDIAANTIDVSARLQLYTAARKELEEFLSKNSSHPLAAAARFDIANVVRMQGKSALAQLKNSANKQAEAPEVQKTLDEAATLLTIADKSLKDQLLKYDDPKTAKEKAEKKELEEAYNRTRLEEALNYLDKAETYIGDPAKVGVARAKEVDKAVTVLDKLVGQTDSSNPINAQARAWLGYCYFQRGEDSKARDKLGDVIKDTGKGTQTGRRLARYFLIRVMMEKSEGKEDPAAEMENWLKDFGAFANTPEGNHIRYLLAQRVVGQGAGQPKGSPKRKQLFTRAKGLLRDLEQSENEYTNDARLLKLTVIQEEGGLDQPVAKLTNFDDCWIRAQWEAHLLDKDAKDAKDPEERKKKTDAHFQTILEALTKGLKLVGPKTPPEDLNNARAFLAYTYLTKEDYPAAIKAGEELAYTRPRPAQASKGATYALMAYTQLVNDPVKFKLTPDQEKEYKDKLHKLAEFIVATWPADPAADVAHHRIAMLLYKDAQDNGKGHPEKWAAVVEELSRIRPSYSEAVFAQYLLAMSAFQADAESKAGPADKHPFKERALEALKAMPAPPPGADPNMVHSYAQGKLALGQHLFQEKKFDEVEKNASAVLAQLKDQAFPDQATHDKMISDLEGQSLFAKYFVADADYKAGKYDKVSASLAPVLADVKAKKLGVLEKELQLRWALLGLALKAQVQQGNIGGAQGILEVIQGLGEKDEAGNNATQTLVQIIQMLKEQIQEIRRKGDKDKLAKTIASFGVFLDALAKNQEKNKTAEMTLLLATAYAGVDNHKKAAQILDEYLKAHPEEPPAPLKKGDPPSLDRARFELIKVSYIRALRQSGQVAEAWKKLDEITDAKDGKPGWGTKNLEALKEKNFLLMEGRPAKDDPTKLVPLYGRAAEGWNGLVTTLQGQVGRGDARLREQYYECYYWLVYCWYKHGQRYTDSKDEKKRLDAIKQAAQFILKLEEKVPDMGGDTSKARFDDLLKAEPALKEQYDALKAAPATAPK
jgi:hypothetical protein